ncbi:uncharacterized protein LOC111249756 [Varroa destructor]|uniref:Fibronectin type-III domain-containing protein n=1 Tax=Varroa destructor TaxID=109461 RepID=A0A7M7K986_VARDE|nr:uncharacterized protein LOC111249756 [Varroa destructor]
MGRSTRELRQLSPPVLSIVLLLFASTTTSLGDPCHLPSQKNVVFVDMPFKLSVENHHEMYLLCRLVSDTIQVGNESIRIDSSNLRFKRLDLAGGYLNTTSPFVKEINKSAIAFVKNDTEVDDSGPYTCVAEAEGRYFPGCTAEVEIGTRPQKVLNFSCIVTAFLNMTCSWTNPDNGKVLTNYTIEVVRGLNMFNRWVSCPANHTTENSCTWTTGSDPYFEKYALSFMFRVNGTNSLGHESWNYMFDHNAILKLTPVTHLNQSNLTERGVTITWKQPAEAQHRNVPYGNVSPEKVIYQITLRRQGAEYKMTETEGPEQISYDNLLPNKEYTVEIRCHMEKATRFDLYSDPAILSFKTLKDKPDGPPVIYQSGFRSKLYTDSRTVTLVFTEVDRDNWNDDTFNYIIQVCPRFSNSDGCKNHTVSHSMLDIEDLSTLTQYEVTIWSNNSIGTANRTSSMTIFSQAEVLSSPQDISVVISEDSASITWQVPDSLRHARDNGELETVLYWCKSFIEDVCNGTAYSKVLPGSRTSDVIKVRQPRDYIYGLGLTTMKTGHSSGVVWSKCVSQAGAYVGLVRELRADADTDTSIKVHWAKMCSSQRKYIGGYQVEYCHIKREDVSMLVNSNDECQRHTLTASVNSSGFNSGSTTSSSSCQKQNFTLEDNEAQYTIEGLTKGESYRIVVRVMDKMSGRYTPDSAAACATANGGMRVIMVVGIGVGCSVGLVVFVIALYMFGKWIHRKVDAAKEVKATLPPPLQKDGGAGYSDWVARVNGVNLNGHGGYLDQHNGDVTILSDFPRRGSHSCLDKLIIEKAPVVTVETPAKLVNGDPRVSANLNREPISLEEPLTGVLFSSNQGVLPRSQPYDASNHDHSNSSPMPPYTQLGLSHLAAGANQVNGHGPHNHSGITGYSQLSVISDHPSPEPIAPPDVIPGMNTTGHHGGGHDDDDDASSGSLEDDNTTDRSPLHSPRRSPASTSTVTRAGGYVSADRAMVTPMPHTTSASVPVSNGYVPVQRANQ